MKILFSVILNLIFLLFWSCSDAGKDPLSSGDETDCTQELDCNSVCGDAAINDPCGVCDGNGSTCSNISYTETIEPLLSSCTGCHGGSSGLSLSTYTSLMIGGNSGAVVTPGDGSGSRLVKKLRGTASGDRMPLGGVYWNDTNINLIETWINEGALDN